MIPAGYLLVPEKLTDEMRTAINDKAWGAGTLRWDEFWEAAIAAAPAPTSPWRRTSETPPPNDGSNIIWMSADGNACIVYGRQVPPLSSGYWKPDESYWMPLSELPPLPAPTLREAAEKALDELEEVKRNLSPRPAISSVIAGLRAALAEEKK